MTNGPVDPTLTATPVPTPEAPPAGPLYGGRYQIVRSLGEGGMGSVFLARDTELHRDVALKVLARDREVVPDAAARFRREARALARLDHPGIVRAYDVGEHDGRPFLVMEYVAGENLAHRLKAAGPLGPGQAAEVGHQVALALDYAHRNGLVHRDVKPGNVILTPDGTAKLLDLGLARFLQDHLADSGRTREGAGMGTPDYSAPEQFRDARAADPRSDVYALGCTLYHVVGGRVPFPGSSLSEKLEAHESRDPTPLEELCPDVPVGLALAVRRMMAKRPADRFPTAAAAADALAPYVRGGAATISVFRETAAWDGSQLGPPGRGRRGGRATAAAGVAAGVLLVLLAGALAQRAGWMRLGRPGAANAPEVVGVGSAGNASAGSPRAEAGPPPRVVEPAVPADPNVLTVTGSPDGGGVYRTIAAALDAVQPGQTIRVLDDAEYPERVVINRPARQAGITLEAPRHATLVLTEGAVLLGVWDVPRVTVRGFRLRSDAPVPTSYLAGAARKAGGLTLQDLEFVQGRCPQSVGISLEGATAADDEPPITVRGCRFSELRYGVRLSGLADDRKSPMPTAGVVVRDNRFDAITSVGIGLLGQLDRVHVVGNTLVACRGPGIELSSLFDTARGIVVANNTLSECDTGIHVTAPAGSDGPTDVTVRNNLILRPRLMDIGVGNAGEEGGPGDGSALAVRWSFGNNWREPPTGKEKGGRVTVAADVERERIEGVDRDPRSPAFLRPARDSELAGHGAGTADPTLPTYVGAVPPEGTPPWDWERTWRGRTRPATTGK